MSLLPRGDEAGHHLGPLEPAGERDDLLRELAQLRALVAQPLRQRGLLRLRRLELELGRHLDAAHAHAATVGAAGRRRRVALPSREGPGGDGGAVVVRLRAECVRTRDALRTRPPSWVAGSRVRVGGGGQPLREAVPSRDLVRLRQRACGPHVGRLLRHLRGRRRRRRRVFIVDLLQRPQRDHLARQLAHELLVLVIADLERARVVLLLVEHPLEADHRHAQLHVLAALRPHRQQHELDLAIFLLLRLERRADRLAQRAALGRFVLLLEVKGREAA